VSGKANHVRIGIDIGGTYTDLMVIGMLNTEMFATKVTSTPQNLLVSLRHANAQRLNQSESYKIQLPYWGY